MSLAKAVVSGTVYRAPDFKQYSGNGVCYEHF